jgi:hypothetical protein
MAWAEISGVDPGEVELEAWSVDGFTIDGDYDDDDDVGNWQSLLSQAIATGGALYDNRQRVKAARRAQSSGVANVQPGTIAPQWTPIPTGTVFQSPSPSQPIGTQTASRMPAWLLPVGLGVVGVFLLRNSFKGSRTIGVMSI